MTTTNESTSAVNGMKNSMEGELDDELFESAIAVSIRIRRVYHMERPFDYVTCEKYRVIRFNSSYSRSR